MKREKEKRNEAGNGPWVLGRTEEGIGIKSPILLRAKPILCYFYFFFTEYIFTYIFSLLAMSFVSFFAIHRVLKRLKRLETKVSTLEVWRHPGLRSADGTIRTIRQGLRKLFNCSISPIPAPLLPFFSLILS